MNTNQEVGTRNRYNRVSMSDPASSVPAYKRVLLKLSGEALMGDQTFGIDPAVATRIATDIGEIQSLGVETAIVIGGGNIDRKSTRLNSSHIQKSRMPSSA